MYESFFFLLPSFLLPASLSVRWPVMTRGYLSARGVSVRVCLKVIPRYYYMTISGFPADLDRHFWCYVIRSSTFCLKCRAMQSSFKFSPSAWVRGLPKCRVSVYPQRESNVQSLWRYIIRPPETWEFLSSPHSTLV